MPRWESSAPPMTTDICTPPRTTSAIWRATACTTFGSTPTSPPPNISPPSLSSTLRKPCPRFSIPSSLACDCAPPSTVCEGGAPPRSRSLRSGLADLEAGEPGDRHAGRVEHRLDGLLGVLHRSLLTEDGVLVEAVDPALDDLGQRLLGLALLAGGLLRDAPLGRDDLLGDLVPGDVPRLHGGDLH